MALTEMGTRPLPRRSAPVPPAPARTFTPDGHVTSQQSALDTAGFPS